MKKLLKILSLLMLFTVELNAQQVAINHQPDNVIPVEYDATNSYTYIFDGINDYINTGLTFTDRTEIEVYGKWLSYTALDKLFGTTTSPYFFIGQNSNAIYTGYNATTGTITGTPTTTDEPVKYKMSASKGYVQAGNYSAVISNVKTGDAIYLGSNHTGSENAHFEMYYAKIWVKNQLVRYYVPQEDGSVLNVIDTTLTFNKGVNDITNGTFDTDLTDWVDSGSGWSVVDGKATQSGTNSQLSQLNAFEGDQYIPTLYTVKFDYERTSGSGGLNVYRGQEDHLLRSLTTQSGTIQFDSVSTNNSASADYTKLLFVPNGGWTGTIDNVEVYGNLEPAAVTALVRPDSVPNKVTHTVNVGTNALMIYPFTYITSGQADGTLPSSFFYKFKFRLDSLGQNPILLSDRNTYRTVAIGVSTDKLIIRVATETGGYTSAISDVTLAANTTYEPVVTIDTVAKTAILSGNAGNATLNYTGTLNTTSTTLNISGKNGPPLTGEIWDININDSVFIPIPSKGFITYNNGDGWVTEDISSTLNTANVTTLDRSYGSTWLNDYGFVVDKNNLNGYFIGDTIPNNMDETPAFLPLLNGQIHYLGVSDPLPPVNPTSGLWIAKTGSDSNDGSFDSPYLTLNYALSQAEPTDTLFIREGVYREDLTINDDSIVIMAYNDEEVEITAFGVVTDFTSDAGTKYYTPYTAFTRTKAHMRINGEYMQEASWNPRSDKANLINRAFTNSWGIMDSNSSTGHPMTITDAEAAGEGINALVDAILHNQTNSWSMRYGRVIAYDNSTGLITTDNNNDTFSGITGNHYNLYDLYTFLDQPGEWWKDAVNNRLYFITPDAGDPNGDLVEVRVREDVLDFNGHDNITLNGIKFTGGRVLKTTASVNNTIINCVFEENDREYLEGEDGNTTYMLSLSDNDLFMNNEVSGTWRNFLFFTGENVIIHNNYFHDMGYANRDGSAIRFNFTGTGCKISSNTFTRFAHSMVAGDNLYQGMIVYNDWSWGNLLTWDVGLLGLGDGSYGNSIVMFNTFHDFSVMTSGIYMDAYSGDITLANNVTWYTRQGDLGQGWGYKINPPSNNIRLYNNTAWEFGNVDGTSATSDIENGGTRIVNNAIQYAVDNDLQGGGAYNANNVIVNTADSASIYTSTTTGDFSLLSTASSLRDQGQYIKGITPEGDASPDVGALQFGETMFHSGHNFAMVPRLDTIPDWFIVAYQNYVDNNSFEYDDLEDLGWEIVSGTPHVEDQNKWNEKDHAKSQNQAQSLEMFAGDTVRQVVRNLTPNTTYELSGYGRLLSDTELRFGATSQFSTNMTWQTQASSLMNIFSYYDMAAGDSLVMINNFDFGSANDYDSIGIMVNSGAIVGVEIYEAGTNTLISSGTLTGPELGWNMNLLSTGGITGNHKLKVVITSVNSSADRMGEMWFFDTMTAETVKVEETTTGQLFNLAGAYFGARQAVEFTTGASQDSAIIEISKVGGYLTGYVDVITITETE